MRFVPYDRLDDTPNLVVDGAADADTVLSLSHWPRSGSPQWAKADLSAEMVFRYLCRPEDAQARRAQLIDVAGAP